MRVSYDYELQGFEDQTINLEIKLFSCSARSFNKTETFRKAPKKLSAPTGSALVTSITLDVGAV